MFELYPDQVDVLDELKVAFRTHRSAVLQASTGWGKTVAAGWLAQAMRRRGRRILVLVHRRELVRQFYNTLKRAGLADAVGVVCSGWPASPWAPIQLAMVFSWVKRRPAFEPDVVVIDEAHHAKADSWFVVIGWYPRAKLLGLTATPKRLDGKPMKPPFETIVCAPSIPALQALRRLALMRVLRPPSSFSVKNLRRNRGDYTRTALDKRADAKVVGESVTAYLRHIPGMRTIMFGVSRRHARTTAEKMRDAGVAAEYVDGDTNERERDRSFDRFAAGRIDMVCNVGLVDEGFDVPECQAVMDVSPTMSVTKYLQRAGRAGRFDGDKVAVLADLVGNFYRHGSPTAERTWSLAGAENGQLVKGETTGANMRLCESCRSLFEPRHAFCPHCGEEHDGRPVREVDVELIEDEAPPPKPPKPPPKMTAKQRNRLLSQCHRMMAEGREAEVREILEDVAEKCEYSPAWHRMIFDNLRKTHRARRRA